MSVRNICFTPDEIRIYSDTMIYEDGKPVGYCERKVWAADRFAVAGRGSLMLVASMADYLTSFGDFDAAEEAALHEVAEEMAGNIEITLAGWSDQRGRLAVIEFKARPGEQPQVVELSHGVTLMPRAGSVELPAQLDDARMVKLCWAQAEVVRRHALSGICIGGRLDVTTVRRDGVTQDVAGHYPAALALAVAA